MTEATNPRVNQIRQRVLKSYEAFLALINGPLAAAEPALLYREPVPGEWTIMQNLAHLVEFMPYWADEVAKLVAEPGRNFGRTMLHEGRLQGIEQRKQDSLEQIREALPGSYTHLARILATLNDRDLEITGVHVKFGEKSLDWFIEEFVTGHMEAHLTQVKAALASLQSPS